MAEIALTKPTEEQFRLLAKPSVRSRTVGTYSNVISEFLASGEPVSVAYQNGDAKAAKSVNSCLNSNITRLDVRAQMGTKLRGSVVFLVRKDA